MGKDPAVLYVVPWCPKCHRVRRFLQAAGRAYREVDPEEDVAGAERLRAAGEGSLDVPAVEVDGRFLSDPSDAELAEALGVPVPEALDLFDVIIVGGGPAGLTAAIYTARERLRTLVLERGLPGGQAAVTGQIENYPGFPDPVSGAELTERILRQAQRFGAEVRTFEEVSALRPGGGLLEVESNGVTHRARGVIVATGSVYRRIGVPGEDRLIGRGVSFCATCDAPFFRGKHVVVVGGGNSALQETVHLAEFAARITLVQVLDRLTASAVLQERVGGLDPVEVLLSQRVTRILGEEGVEAVEVTDLSSGEHREIPCDGVFVFIGLVPNSRFLAGALDLDETGFVRTDPVTLATSLPRVYAAGDVRAGSAKQITAAVGEGTVASFMVQAWLGGSGAAGVHGGREP
ncbi:MAG: FAD-dependent oxidoreductase [Deferrisomatales bacterium]|nr:FAD-dependent oxidoreductase [Deferrisomatales bacterium]